MIWVGPTVNHQICLKASGNLQSTETFFSVCLYEEKVIGMSIRPSLSGCTFFSQSNFIHRSSAHASLILPSISISNNFHTGLTE